MYVAKVPNRNSPPAYLLREGYREGEKVKSRTLANLSHWPLAKIDRLRRVLRDEVLSGGTEGLTMLRSLPHGPVAAVLGTARRIGLDRLLAAGRAPARLAALVLAMIVARVIDPASKLATARQLDAATATTSLGPLLELDMVSEQELYAALDWLLSQQSRIERRLAQRHLSSGHAGALRCEFDVFRRPHLSLGTTWLQPRWQARQAADRVRSAVRQGRLPGGGRGV